MTKEKFTFQIDLTTKHPIKISGLPIVRYIIMEQDDSKIAFEEGKLNEMIQTLEACRRWLNSP